MNFMLKAGIGAGSAVGKPTMSPVVTLPTTEAAALPVPSIDFHPSRCGHLVGAGRHAPAGEEDRCRVVVRSRQVIAEVAVEQDPLEPEADRIGDRRQEALHEGRHAGPPEHVVGDDGGTGQGVPG